MKPNIKIKNSTGVGDDTWVLDARTGKELRGINRAKINIVNHDAITVELGLSLAQIDLEAYAIPTDMILETFNSCRVILNKRGLMRKRYIRKPYDRRGI